MEYQEIKEGEEEARKTGSPFQKCEEERVGVFQAPPGFHSSGLSATNTRA